MYIEFVVYILYSSKFDKIYIGFTSNLIERFKSHNLLGKKGWTIRYRPWEVVYGEFYDDKKSARRRESELKGAKSRETIRRRITAEFRSVGFISA